MDSKRSTRREALMAAGIAGGVLLGGAVPKLTRGLLSPSEADAASSMCTLETPELEEGPFWVNTELNRSNIIANTASASVDPGVSKEGVPLTITVKLFDRDNDCAPWVGVQVDIWHASPEGLYSDEQSQKTEGQNYLRGYQITDEEGAVTFETIYPGWYGGRAVHLHFRIRTFDGTTTTYDRTTQFFFKDEQNDEVMENVEPYKSRGKPEVTDEDDRVFTTEGDPSTNAETSVVTLSGSNAEGYTGTIDIALDSDGLAETGSSGSSSESSSSESSTSESSTSGSSSTDASTTSATTTSSTTSAGGSAAKAPSTALPSLISAQVLRDRNGKRTLVLRVDAHERTTLVAALARGKHQITSTRATLAGGTRELKLAIPAATLAGEAVLELRMKAGAGSEHKRVGVRIPRG